MKKAPLFRFMLGLSTILVILLSSCSNNGVSTTKPNASSAISNAPIITPKTAATSSVPGQTIPDILGMADKITTIKYDIAMTSPGMDTLTTTMWMKNNKLRTEMSIAGQTTIGLYDIGAGTYYVYMPSKNTAMKMNFSPFGAPQTIGLSARTIMALSPNMTDTETIDGKSCWILSAISGQDSYKIWIWRDNGIPIRYEITASNGKTIMEYKNIDLSDIPDSIFILPEGVTVTESP
jgi:outer membrane lipoprotein-sorting protein